MARQGATQATRETVEDRGARRIPAAPPGAFASPGARIKLGGRLPPEGAHIAAFGMCVPVRLAERLAQARGKRARQLCYERHGEAHADPYGDVPAVALPP